MKTHAIRSFSIGDPDLLAAVCREHAEMIDLLKRNERERLVTLVGQHLQPAKNAYLKLARHRAPFD
jgi:DNA-binding GntR family transcriptional regulator